MSFLKKAGRAFKKVFNLTGVGQLMRGMRKWLTPDMPDKDKYKVQRRGSDHFVPVVYGQQKRVHGIVVDENTHGDDDQFLSVLIVFCIGEIESFDKWYFNGVSSDDDRWKGKFEIQPFFGSDTQNPVNGAGRLNRWDSTHSHYRGLAGALITFESIQDETIWGGLPEITVDMHGRKVYDPRTDSVAWTENPGLILLDYVKLPSPLGKGLTDDDVNTESFINVANISDITNTDTVTYQICEPVDTGDPEVGVIYQCRTETNEIINNRRFSFNGIVDAEQQIFSNIEEIATAFRGYFPDGDGRLTVAAEIEADPVFDFDASNIVSSITSRLPDKNSRYNQVVVRFPNLENDGEYDEVAWPESDSQTYQDWLEEDDGISLQHTIRTEICGHKAEAIQLARIAALVSRFGETVEFTGAFEAAQLDVGDVVTITEENRGWGKRQFRIDEINYRDDGLVDITAEQHDNAFYPWVTLDYTEIIGGINLGDPFSPEAPTGLQLIDDNDLQTTGRLQWDGVGAAFVRYYDVEIYNAGELVEQYRTTSQRYTVPLLDAGNYEARVYSVSTVDGRRSPPATLSFSLVTPIAPSNLRLTVGNWEVASKPLLPGAGLGTQWNFYVTQDFDEQPPFTPMGTGYNFTRAGLMPDTDYRIWAQTVSPLGVSDWVYEDFTTRNDPSQIENLVGDLLQDPAIIGEVVSELTESVERRQDRLRGTAQALVDDALQELDDLDNKGAIIRAEKVQEGLVQNVQLLTSDVNGVKTTVLQVQEVANNAEEASAIALQEVQVVSEEAEATSNLLNSVIQDPAGNSEALASLFSGVTGESGSAQAVARLQALFEDGGLLARGFFGTQVQGDGAVRLAGMVVQDDGEVRVVEFAGDTIRFVRADGSSAIVYDTSINEFVFDGRVTARSIAAESISSEQLEATALYGKRSVVRTGTGSSDIAVVTDPGTVELPSDLIHWIGPGNVSPSNRNRTNATYFVGTTPGDVKAFTRSARSVLSGGASASWSSIGSTSYNSVQGWADMIVSIVNVSGVFIGPSPPGGPGSVAIEVRIVRGSTVVSDTVRVDLELLSSSPISGGTSEYQYAYNGGITLQGDENRSSVNYNTSTTYGVQMRWLASGAAQSGSVGPGSGKIIVTEIRN